MNSVWILGGHCPFTRFESSVEHIVIVKLAVSFGGVLDPGEQAAINKVKLVNKE